MDAMKFRKVQDEVPTFLRWELGDLAACRVAPPRDGGRIWTWSAWTDSGRYENGMAHSKQSAISEAKSSAIRLVSEDLDGGLTRDAQMSWEQGLFVDTGPHPKRGSRLPS